jgi:hypothetical protein
MSVKTTLKREALTQAWIMLIHNATGKEPIVERFSNGAKISWHPGQAKLMEKYLADAMKGSDKPEPDALNVDVNLAPVLLPLAVKKSLGWIVLYTGLVYATFKILGR